jgi:FkbM family methyltransferase
MNGQERWYAESMPLRNQVVADVGANVGRLSQFFWDASGGTSRVVSIEPLSENVAAIRERIRAAATDRWTVEPCAVSAHTGSVGLAVARTAQGEWNSAVTAARAARTVPCRPLAEIVPDATVVKLDIEGHEYPVIEDALPRLRRVHSWALELHMVEKRPLQTVLGSFMAQGYRLFAATRNPGDPGGAWVGTEIMATLDWSSIPVTSMRKDGSAFKMLHVVARRTAEGE